MEKLKPKRVEESVTVMTELIMPGDTNPIGNLMGGYLMRWMDIAGGICAAKHAEKHVVTASVDHISFASPINNGDVITITACVTRAFRSSLEVYIEVVANGITGDNQRKANHAYFTFVALDEETRKPTRIPEIIPLTAEQQARYESASRRRELRLVLSGRMKASDATEIKDFFKKL